MPEIKTPFLTLNMDYPQLESVCPMCSSLMEVSLLDLNDLSSDFIQVCRVCKYQQPLKE